jgi:hypothetical protein
MYAAWWVTIAQYLALLLWLPALLERALPGMFPPWLTEAPRVVLPQHSVPVLPPSPKPSVRLTTFHELEQELGEIAELEEWVVFSPDRLPVWHSGQETSPLLQAPEVLRRVAEAWRPLLRPEWGDTIEQGLFQTEEGYCLMLVLPGDFLFGSLWSTAPGPSSAKAVLMKVIERSESLLQLRFSDIR